MIEVMREHAESIRLELPGEDGAEFRLCYKEGDEYHQVKRQQTSAAFKERSTSIRPGEGSS